MILANIMAETTLNFAFPGFVLEVWHTPEKVIFSRLKSGEVAIPPIIGIANELTKRIKFELDAYLQDSRHKFNLPLDFSGSSHQLQVWQIMTGIHAGSVLTYGAVAKRLGSSALAVGSACGKNPLPIFIPCHRIIGTNHQLGGFNSGKDFASLAIKHWLLEHEGVRI